MLTIDSHVHAWRYDRLRHEWIEPDSVLAADHLPGQVVPALDDAGIDRIILVQAESSDEETRWLLSLARRDCRIAGVVGWLNLSAADVADRAAALARDPLLIGIRHQVQGEPDDYLDRDDIARGVDACLAAGLAYDILVYPRQLPAVRRFLRRVGQGRLILDHGGKPPIAAGGWQPWADDIRAIAAFPNVWCKLSGLVTEADHRAWQPPGIDRYMNLLLQAFGPARLIFGSDWPVCRLAADYATVHRLVDDFVARRCPDHRAAIMGGNAARAYRLAD